MIRAFSPDETGDDSVDITVSDRLGTCIVTGRYGAGLGFSYKNCHHGLTIFATALQAADEVAMQLLEDDVQREATYKSVTDIRDSKGKSPPMAEDYYTLMAWLKNYMVVLQTLFGKLYPLLQTHQRLRVTIINMKRINTNYFTKNNIVNLI